MRKKRSLRINKDLKRAESTKISPRRLRLDALRDPFGIIDTAETGSAAPACSLSSACSSLSFSRARTRDVPSDQSQGCPVSSHCYSKCHCVLVHSSRPSSSLCYSVPFFSPPFSFFASLSLFRQISRRENRNGTRRKIGHEKGQKYFRTTWKNIFPPDGRSQ